MTKFGDLQTLDLRRIWPKEDKNFTPWLADNIQKLGTALGIDLELESKEADVGDFSLDLLARDVGRDRTVVIENQLESTDHDHLGKLLTYASGFDASVVIWVSKSFREEHRQALDWLNQQTDSETEFFGVVVEVIKIDDSKPACVFKPVVFPNEWQKTKHAGSSKPSVRGEAYRSFFQGLIDELREEHRFTGARKGQPQNWYTFSSGHSGVYYGVNFAQGGRIRVELYIHQDDKNLFDELHRLQDKVEKNYGGALEWERLESKIASRIAIYRPGTIDSDEDTLTEIQSWAIQELLKFKKTFGPLLENIKTK